MPDNSHADNSHADKKDPKILSIVTRLNIGGPAILTIMLTREMRSFGFQTALVSGSCEPDEGDMSFLLEPSDSVFWIPEMSRSVSPFRNLVALWRIWRVLRRERPSVVHTHTAMAGCLGRVAAMLANVPVVVHTFHGNSLQEYFSPLVNRVFLAIERALAKRTDAICVLSPQQADELSGKFRLAPREKFHVVPLGLDLDPFLAIEPLPAENGILRVGWLGRFVPVKNVPLLAEIVSEAVARIPGIQFVIAGDGADAAIVRDLVCRHPGSVVWAGWLKDVTSMIASCNVVIQTSRNEGTPVALIQAMAAGRPFIATPVGGVIDMVELPEFKSEDGNQWFRNAVLAPGRAEAFVSVLERFQRQPELIAELGENARNFAQAHYRKEALASNLDRLYRGLMASDAEATIVAEHRN
jgi:glycosyltransferase involved in cell wall biosynthesis